MGEPCTRELSRAEITRLSLSAGMETTELEHLFHDLDRRAELAGLLHTSRAYRALHGSGGFQFFAG